MRPVVSGLEGRGVGPAMSYAATKSPILSEWRPDSVFILFD